MAKKPKSQPTPPTPPAEPLPATLDEAVAFLQARTALAVIAELRATPFDDLARLHRDLGMQVRAVLGLWGRNPALLASLPTHAQWPDDAGMYIIEAWWRELQVEEDV